MEGKKLYRSRTDRMLAGVAGGIAEYFEIDSTLVRILMVILAIWGGIGILLYVIGAIVIPEEPEGVVMAEKKSAKNKKNVEEGKVVEEKKTVAQEAPKEKTHHDGTRGNQVFGVIILSIGLIFLLEMYVPGFSFGKLWPLVLIGLGLWILAGQGRE